MDRDPACGVETHACVLANAVLRLRVRNQLSDAIEYGIVPGPALATPMSTHSADRAIRKICSIYPGQVRPSNVSLQLFRRMVELARLVDEPVDEAVAAPVKPKPKRQRKGARAIGIHRLAAAHSTRLHLARSQG
jgi:hypothetical protein